MNTRSLFSGLLCAALITALAFSLNALPGFSFVSPLLFAILVGMAARNLGLIPAICNVGLTFSAKKILRAGVVLLGLRLSLPEVASLGWGPVLVILVTVACIYGLTLILGRWLRVPHTTSVLTATGTAICGASAIAGMSAVVREQPERTGKVADEKVDAAAATAIACITIFGTVAMFLLPSLASALGLSAKQSGVWLGASIHEVGQVVAAGGFVSPEVATYATVTKLGRVVLLAPMVALVGYFEGRSSEQNQTREATNKTPLLPLFVLGFLAMVLIRSVLGWAHLDASLQGFLSFANLLTNILLTLAMAGMGASVRLATVLSTGIRAAILTALASIIAAAVSLVLVLALV